MKIYASSIKPEYDSYLHAGYVSAAAFGAAGFATAQMIIFGFYLFTAFRLRNVISARQQLLLFFFFMLSGNLLTYAISEFF